MGELLELLKLFFDTEKQQPSKAIIDTTKDNRHFVYGLSGIAGLFGCSKTTANRIKQSGKIDKAITQIGNLIIVDSEKARELAGTVNIVKNNGYVKRKTGIHTEQKQCNRPQRRRR